MNCEKAMDLLTEQIESCKRCELWRTRNKPMIGDGCLNVKIMMIGEAPGYNEDLSGKAFVGKSGEILDVLLDFVNLSREDIYITNVLKCHPPSNHNPTPKEIQACISFLYEQIKILKPVLIITLGKFASQTLFHKVKLPFSRISAIHGMIFEIQASYGNVNIVPLYHPSVACYNPNMLEILKNDFQNSVGKLFKGKIL